MIDFSSLLDGAALKLIFFFTALEVSHGIARRWTWVALWAFVGTAVGAFEHLANGQFGLWLTLLYGALWLIPLYGFMMLTIWTSKKKTITKEFRELWDKEKFPNDYNPVMGIICLTFDFLFIVWLIGHLSPFKW